MKGRSYRTVSPQWVLLAVVTFVVATPAQAEPPWAALEDVLEFESSEQLLVNRLYPIGFSRSGKFAYLIVPADDAVGCFLWHLVVVDLVNDKAVGSIGWRDYEEAECYNVEDLRTVVERHGAEISRLLDKHRIEASPVTLKKFPLSHEGDTITVELAAQPTRVIDESTRKTSSDVVLRSSRRGEKTIGRVEAIEIDALPYVYGHRVWGSIASPHEDRIVVVVREERLGWEGPPSVAGSRLFGASLARGFAHANLESFLDSARALGLVTPEGDAGSSWCRRGKPEASEPIRVVGDACIAPFSTHCDVLSQASRTRALTLRETGCSGSSLRLEVTQWSFGTTQEAKGAGERLAIIDHNDPALKRVHRLWRNGRRLYFADAGAFRHWDRFDELMKTLGLREHLCGHR